MRKKVVSPQPVPMEALGRLTEIADVVVVWGNNDRNLMKELEDAHAYIVRSVPGLNKQMLDIAEKLEVIARVGVGLDGIDVAEATKRKIPVIITPVHMETVAEHVIAGMLALSRRLMIMDKNVRLGNFEVRHQVPMSDLKGKILGLIGVGRIGSTIARKCRLAFDMKVIAYDPYLDPEKGKNEYFVLVKELRELLRMADYISINCPLTDQTRKLIGERELRMMKPEAFLINTSRGGVVDEEALVGCLAENIIAGAFIDVFDPEPPTADNRLFKMENVLLTPHVAGLTRESILAMFRLIGEEIVSVFERRRATSICNPEIYEVV